ncbi:hypothetical protein ACOMHN_055132 [Nucella lapillus]
MLDPAESRRQEREAMFYSRHGGSKKRRKSRTAFSNQQIYQLEKRFLFQKYLTPSDRDDIAHTLGLSNAQVITWFQNRRAKLKRDLEELKNDVTAAEKHSLPRTTSHPDRRPRKKHHPRLLRHNASERPGKAPNGRGSASAISPSSPISSPARGGLIARSSSSSSSSSALTSDACGTKSPSGEARHDSMGVSSSKMHNRENNPLKDNAMFFSEDLCSTSSCDHVVVDDNDNDAEAGSLSEDQSCCMMESDGDSSGSFSGTDSLPASSLRRPFQTVAAVASLRGRQHPSAHFREHVLYTSEDDDVEILDEPENLSLKSLDCT